MQASFACVGVFVCSAKRFTLIGYFSIRSDESQNPRPTNLQLDGAPSCVVPTRNACLEPATFPDPPHAGDDP